MYTTLVPLVQAQRRLIRSTYSKRGLGSWYESEAKRRSVTNPPTKEYVQRWDLEFYCSSDCRVLSFIALSVFRYNRVATSSPEYSCMKINATNCPYSFLLLFATMELLCFTIIKQTGNNPPLYIQLWPIVYFNNGDYLKCKRATWKWQLRMKNDHYYRYN